jgi:TonB-dependent SusC/RagA subfamily outer membrane receptor
MKTRLLIFILIAGLFGTSVSAQKSNKKITITGTVLDVAKGPITNAIIMVDDQKTSSVTDSKGKYKVKVKPDATKIGVFTFGNGTSEQPINGRIQIDFKFGTEASQTVGDQPVAPGDEATEIGYGVTKKKYVTGTVKTVDGTNKKYASYRSALEIIQRENTGVKISGNTVIIQDSKDLFGSVPALIVVDGVYMDYVPDIPVTSIKSIEVLKGASAAIYGSRGYGGAIVIKTKIQN